MVKDSDRVLYNKGKITSVNTILIFMAKGKGFWGRKDKDQNKISVESIVRGDSLEPIVVIKWGKEGGYLAPEEARSLALTILGASCAAKSDSAVVKFFSSIDGFGVGGAALFRKMLREFRVQNRDQNLSGIRMVIDPDEEPIPIQEVTGQALYMLEMAVMSEVEAFLVEYLKQEVNMDEYMINRVIGELRDIMYPKEG
jgi:hypothetical protein